MRFSANIQEYFAEVDEDYILDRFNLTGLNGEVVQEYQRALDLITDCLGELREPAEADAQMTRTWTTRTGNRSRRLPASCTD